MIDAKDYLRFASGMLSQCVFALAVSLPTCAAAAELPDFAKVETLVQGHFAGLADHQPGDLISQSQVTPIFGQLERLGWTVADRALINNSLLPDNNYLVAQFRTTAGAKFMRKVSADKLAYDRLDQIARMPGGKLMIKDFQRFPHADLTFTQRSSVPVSRYARFTPEQDRSQAPTAADLNKPTGRIYTAAQLVSRLKASYDEEAMRRAQK